MGLGVAITWVGAVVLTFAAGRAHRFDRRVPHFERPRREATVAIVAVLAQIAVLAIVFAIRASSSAIPPASLEPGQRYDVARLLTQLSLVAVAAAPVVAVLVFRRPSPSTLGLSTGDLLAQLALGLAIGVVALLALGKGGALTGVGAAEVMRLGAFGAVGFVEEIVYRGFLQGRLVSWLGERRGWLGASAMFAVAHLPQDLTSDGPTLVLAVELALQFVYGLVFGWVALRVGGVWATGVAHALADWVGWL